MIQKKEEKSGENNNLMNMDTLTKLRLVITSIFILSTLSMILAFINYFIIAVGLILLSYILVFILMVKLWVIKEL